MATQSRFYRRLPAAALMALVLLLFGVLAALAQTSISRIVVTKTAGESAPTIELYVYAVDGSGNAADLANQSLEVIHDGQPVSEVTVDRKEAVGTLTIFVLDIPQGVAEQIPQIRDIILQYATAPNMQEQTDYVAISKVGELGPETILAPETFYNGVRNAFATLPEASTGSTALIDNLMVVLDNLAVLKPNADMVAHLVVFSDGTDTASSQFQQPDVPRKAAELGIPVHTIWLDNPSVSASKEGGRQYMEQIADGTGGMHLNLLSVDDQAVLWQRIAAFRDHTVLRYTVEGAAGGDYPVEVRLANNQAVRDQATVTIPPGAPSIVIDLPPSARQLTVTDINQSVSISLATNLSWLDGVEREITSASLLLNGSVFSELDPASLNRFNVDLTGLREGPNRVQIAVVDSEGGRAVSPVVELTVSLGAETSVPTEVQPQGAFDQWMQRLSRYRSWGIGCLGVLGVLILMAILAAVGSRSSFLRQTGLLRGLYRLPFLRPFMSQSYTIQRSISRAKRYSRYVPEVKSVDEAKAKARGGATTAFLEVIQSVTSMPPRLELSQVEVKLGRSTKQADLVFHNDPTMSRIHATIVKEGVDYRIFDEQSTGGSYVNEQRVPQPGLQLVDGDEVRLGAVRLRFRQL